ncbi:MAG TPA: hypothetical protein VJ873_08455 [bacterium]|nr:hypothetical protein [bacterium]
MFSALLQRVPWEKFFLLWFLAVLMGSSLLWLHYGFSPKILGPVGLLVFVSALGLLWGTTRPRWQKAHCDWCGTRVKASVMKFDQARKVWVLLYRCEKCGQMTEKLKSGKD